MKTVPLHVVIISTIYPLLDPNIRAKLVHSTFAFRWLRRDGPRVIAKLHLDWNQSRFGRPLGSPDPRWPSPGCIFLWVTDKCALSLIPRCIL